MILNVIRVIRVHTQKNWVKCCKISMKYWLNFQSIMTQSKFHPTFTGQKLIENFDWNLNIFCVCIESVVSPLNQKWLKCCILIQYWLNSKINQKFLCVCSQTTSSYLCDEVLWNKTFNIYKTAVFLRYWKNLHPDLILIDCLCILYYVSTWTG